jgi:hypothetical protein
MTDDETTASKDDAAVWKNLVTWIHRDASQHNETDGDDRGTVHPALTLRTIEADHRGVFAISPIHKGEILIRLPVSHAIHGDDEETLPTTWNIKTENQSTANSDCAVKARKTTSEFQRQASPWLRCLAAFWEAQEDETFYPYFASLPTFYETVWEWSTAEIHDYLNGTSTQGGAAVGWQISEKSMQERFKEQIRPYLVYCGILAVESHQATDIDADENNQLHHLLHEYNRFSVACQCLSTRGFHLSTTAIEESKQSSLHKQRVQGDTSRTKPAYPGPFLLPLIDLLNHSTELRCTSLQRFPDAFVMIAEREIALGEEILHSYGDDLTASQFLQTFGFVPRATMMNRCNSTAPEPSTNELTMHTLSPAILRKQEVMEGCFQVIEEMSLPTKLAASMEAQNMEDEVWSVAVDRSRQADFISDDLLIDAANPLTDELVTLCCLPFLPQCAYQEAASGLLDRSILEDYFLGKLVCTSLLRIIETKLTGYETLVKGRTLKEDQRQLRELLKQETSKKDGKCFGTLDWTTERRLQYGLTICVEEKMCLAALRRKVLQVLTNLDQDAAVELETVDCKRPRV